jgi:hypothetical protein
MTATRREERRLVLLRQYPTLPGTLSSQEIEGVATSTEVDSLVNGLPCGVSVQTFVGTNSIPSPAGYLVDENLRSDFSLKLEGTNSDIRFSKNPNIRTSGNTRRLSARSITPRHFLYSTAMNAPCRETGTP